jgi:hypothetical protein
MKEAKSNTWTISEGTLYSFCKILAKVARRLILSIRTFLYGVTCPMCYLKKRNCYTGRKTGTVPTRTAVFMGERPRITVTHFCLCSVPVMCINIWSTSAIWNIRYNWKHFIARLNDFFLSTVECVTMKFAYKLVTLNGILKKKNMF